MARDKLRALERAAAPRDDRNGLVDGRPLSQPVPRPRVVGARRAGVTPASKSPTNPDRSTPPATTTARARAKVIGRSSSTCCGRCRAPTSSGTAWLAPHPAYTIGIVELSAVWVPMYLMMLDGGTRLVERLNGRSVAKLDLPPANLRQQVTVCRSSRTSCHGTSVARSAAPNILMDVQRLPAFRGHRDPLADYAGTGRFATRPEDEPAFFGGQTSRCYLGR